MGPWGPPTTPTPLSHLPWGGCPGGCLLCCLRRAKSLRHRISIGSLWDWLWDLLWGFYGGLALVACSTHSPSNFMACPCFAYAFSMIFYGFLWIFYGFSMAVDGASMGFRCFAIGFSELAWDFYGISVIFYGFLCVCMGCLWDSMLFYGISTPIPTKIIKFRPNSRPKYPNSDQMLTKISKIRPNATKFRPK